MKMQGQTIFGTRNAVGQNNFGATNFGVKHLLGELFQGQLGGVISGGAEMELIACAMGKQGSPLAYLIFLYSDNTFISNNQKLCTKIPLCRRHTKLLLCNLRTKILLNLFVPIYILICINLYKIRSNLYQFVQYQYLFVQLFELPSLNNMRHLTVSAYLIRSVGRCVSGGVRYCGGILDPRSLSILIADKLTSYGHINY